MAAIFYIGGLVNQFNLNYQKWLAEGGITGKATMDAICFSPVCCWRSAMTASGLKCVALVAVIGSGVYLFIHFQDRFGNGDYDPRNFSRSKRGTYGTAGWMSDKEMRDQINRELLERQYNQLFAEVPAAQVSKGREALKTTLEVAGSVLAIGSSALGIALAIKELKG